MAAAARFVFIFDIFNLVCIIFKSGKIFFYLVFHFRRTFEDVLTFSLAYDSSSDSDSSDKDDLDFLLVDTLFPDSNEADYSRPDLDDFTESQCGAMFRSVILLLSMGCFPI